MSTFRTPRPALAIRVGVTGHRQNKLRQENLVGIRGRARIVLESIATVVRGVAAEAPEPQEFASVANAYQHDPISPKVSLRVVSPLAEGADRLVAHEALELGYDLEVPLPFLSKEYENDFPQSIDEFQNLLGQAISIFELDGARSKPGESYDAAGRFVVRNCDVLIAIWDGNDVAGVGGTANIVQYAARSNVPIWWIHSDDPAAAPRLITSLREWRNLKTWGGATDATDRLKRYLKRTLCPPRTPSDAPQGILARLAHNIARRYDPLTQYMESNELPPRRWLWKTYAKVMNLLVGRVVPGPRMLGPYGPIEIWWDRFYDVADQCSSAYGDRIRSSYVLVIGIAMLGIVIATINALLPVEARWITVGGELFTLTAILLLVIASHTWRWHERWTALRLLAELFRCQRVLASLGRSVPRRQVESLQSDEASQEGQREAWVAWYFAAAQRAARLPHGRIGDALERAKELGMSLIAEQQAYHRNRAHRYHKAGLRLKTLGEVFFLLALIAAGIELYVVHVAGADERVLKGIDGLLALLPAASAAFVSLRTYSEFEVLEQQSNKMIRLLGDASGELSDIDVVNPAPLCSQELGTALHAVAGALLEDVGGWMQLAGIKGLETG